LHRPDRETREPFGNAGIEALSVSLDLELDARPAEALGNIEEVRNDERLAPVRAISSATRIASRASSSSASFFPGADSVQQCRQQRSQSRVNCHETKRGAPS